MKLAIVGVSHKTAPVELRESLAFGGDVAPALEAIVSCEGVEEAMILSTCNRVEIALAAAGDADPAPLGWGFFVSRQGVPQDALASAIYRYEGRDAIRHLFRVASSLDSMVVGEPQILGQLKQAYNAAKQCGALHGWMDGLVSRAFSVAKRVRSETGIGQMAVSVSYAAVELARKIFGSLNGRSVMIIGAGKMSELAARHLRRSGRARIFVANRTPERAAEMAKLFQGTAVDYAELGAVLPDMDIVIASSAAPHYILTREEMQRVIAARRNRPMFLIDIAVPRNIEPSVNEIDNVFLYDVDDLREVVDANLQERGKAAERAEAVVEEEVDRMMARLNVAEVTPDIVRFQEQLEHIRAAEMEKVRRKFGPFTPRQEEAMEALTRAILNKVAHGPITQLRHHAGKPEEAHMVAAIRKAFHLQDQ